MSETDLVSTEPATPRKRGGLTGMVLAELRQLAGELKIPDTAGMRKGDLIAAIRAAQGGTRSRKPARHPALAVRRRPDACRRAGHDQQQRPGRRFDDGFRRRTGALGRDRAEHQPAAPGGLPARGRAGLPAGRQRGGSGGRTPRRAANPWRPTFAPAERRPAPEASAASVDAPSAEPEVGGRRQRQRRRAEQPSEGAESGTADGGEDRQRRTRDDSRRDSRDDSRRESRDDGRRTAATTAAGESRDDSRRDGRDDARRDDRADNRNARNDGRARDDDSDDDGDGRGRRGRRFRDRRRGRDRGADRGAQGGQNIDTEVRDGDVLLPVAGIVDILDNYAFVRTTGYLSGPTDVYVSLSIVRKYGLRRGDAITGAVREVREGEQTRQKFNPLVRVDSINGQDPETARSRPEFTKLTPLYPNERLRLETEPHKLTTRVIDLVMPVGKGQRALIVSPPKAGKTMIMQAIANAITTNNPECHLMVVLVDERPEEVTDMQRSVKGEVIASTFDRPPTDHTTVAELSIERAKRLVEMGHDVVVLLDNITRLGRAYNLAAPASGRILSGGVDSTALYPPKRFLGAARNIEDGGSLTIFATALVETGSTMDTVIFEEFKGTGNAELKLDRKIADKRIYPAIDVGDSSTRKDELLLSPDEYAVMVKLRRVLSGLDDQQAIDLLLTQLRKTRTNIEFLMQVAKSTPATACEAEPCSCAARPFRPPGGGIFPPPGWFNESSRSGSGSPRSAGDPAPHREEPPCDKAFTRSTSRPRSPAAAATTSPPAAPRPAGHINVEVCSACHPFYTGKQKILDSGGRVARFEARYGKRGPRKS